MKDNNNLAILYETYSETERKQSDMPPSVAKKLIDAVQDFRDGTLYIEPYLENIVTSSDKRIKGMYATVCYSCQKVAIWRHNKIVYPEQRHEIEPNEDLPDDVKYDFNEAREILSASPRGAAALLRLCVQKICQHHDLPGKNINEDIAILVSQGLSRDVQMALDSVRVIGNEAVHPGELDLKDDTATASALFNLVNRIAYELLSQKREIEEIYASLPKSKRKGIDNRDKKS